MSVEFVPAKLAEAEELSELRRCVWQTTYRGIYPDDMIDHFDFAFHNARNRMFIESKQFLTFFIVHNGEKAGYLILKPQNPLHLQSLYLLETYRGKGIGTMAFDFVRRYCRDHGIARFDLDCHPDNKGAIVFYTKMGGIIVSRDVGHARSEENGIRFAFEV